MPSLLSLDSVDSAGDGIRRSAELLAEALGSSVNVELDEEFEDGSFLADLEGRINSDSTFFLQKQD